MYKRNSVFNMGENYNLDETNLSGSLQSIDFRDQADESLLVTNGTSIEHTHINNHINTGKYYTG